MRRIEGDFTVEAPPQAVLAYCGDLRNVLPALPGLAEIKEATGEAAVIVINAGVSFVRGRFTVRLAQTEKTASGMKFKGHGDGAGNAVDFESSLDVAPAGPASTVHWVSEVRVHGPLASMAAGLLNPVINQNVELFVGKLKQGLEASSQGAATSAVVPEAQPSFFGRLWASLARLFGGKS